MSALKDKLAAGAIDKAVEAGVKAATTELSNAVSPATNSKVVSLPASVTGGTDTAKSVTGKSGSITQDMNGDGETESVDVLVSDGGVTYLSWETNGVCFMSWVDSAGKEYVEFADCGDETGAWVCSGNDPNYTCKGCTADGDCQVCEDNDLSTCVWGESSDGADGSADDDGSEDASDVSDGGDGATDDGSDMTDMSDGATDDGSDMTDMSDGATDDGSDMTDMSDGATDDGSDMTDMSDGATDDGSDMTDMSDGATDATDSSEGSDGSMGSTCSQAADCISTCQGDSVCEGECLYLASPEASDLLVAWATCLDAYCPEGPENCFYCDEEATACLND